MRPLLLLIKWQRAMAGSTCRSENEEEYQHLNVHVEAWHDGEVQVPEVVKEGVCEEGG